MWEAGVDVSHQTDPKIVICQGSHDASNSEINCDM
jgi:hypothetical protein